MSKMNLADWPVECFDEYEGIIFDVTRFLTEDENKWIYCVLINFLENSGDDESGPRGFTLITGIVENDLRAIKKRIDMLINSGLFDDVTVSAHGTLFDEEHNELDQICWNSFDDSNDETEITHSAPSTIQ